MRIIRDRFGFRRGEKSVTVIIKKQNSPEPSKVITLTRTSTAQVYTALMEYFRHLEDNVSVAEVVSLLSEVKTTLASGDNKSANKILNSVLKELKKW